MLMNPAQFLALALIIAGSAFVYSQVLTAVGMPFYFLKQIRMPEWLEKPLYSCSTCVSGQWSLWLAYLYFKFPIVEIILFTLSTMFFMWLIEKYRSR